MKHTPTNEQKAILHALSSSKTSLMISALAGCAKTTTLELLSHKSTVPGIALAFNVKIKKELEKRFPPTFQVKTLNGLGHNAWSKTINKHLTIDERKLGKIVSQTLRETKVDQVDGLWDAVRSTSSLAMQRGLTPAKRPTRGILPDTEETWKLLTEETCGEANEQVMELSRLVIEENVKQGYLGTVSFDDQIYLSSLFGGAFPKTPLLFVDEAQDLSPLNAIQVARTAGLNGRLVIVGDTLQAIYAFRGADSESMLNLRKLRSEWIDLPLRTTFRCPQQIVARQQSHASGFVAAAQAPEGEVQIIEGNWGTGIFSGGEEIAILCRNNAPLLSIAFKLLKQQIPVVMLGRDIGKGLVALSKKILPMDGINREQCATLINKWMEQESSIARANEDDNKLEAIEDKGQCLLAVLASSDAIDTSEKLRSSLEQLFAGNSGRITLSSIHRSKGLEWDTVIHLDPWRIPGRFATSPAALQQENNLRYVAETRTKRKLILANAQDFQSK